MTKCHDQVSARACDSLRVLLWISDLLSQPHNPIGQFLESTSSCLCLVLVLLPWLDPGRHAVTPTLCSSVPTAVTALLPGPYCSLQRLPGIPRTSCENPPALQGLAPPDQTEGARSVRGSGSVADGPCVPALRTPVFAFQAAPCPPRRAVTGLLQAPPEPVRCSLTRSTWLVDMKD